jgi:phosphatidylinositol glycan class W
VLHGARGGWLEANREGLLTLLAYAAISAAAVAVKYAADAAQEAAYASKAPARAVKGPLRLSRAPLRIVGLLLGLTCVCAVVAWAAGAWALPLGDAALQSLVEGQAAPGTLLPVSRRLGNTAFVSWIVGLCSLLLAMAHAPAALGLPLLTATDAAPAAEPLLCGPVLALVNRHALLSFLAANLLTGAVNLSVDTMGVRDGAAMVVLVGYLGCVCAVLLAKEYYDSSRLRIKEKQR